MTSTPDLRASDLIGRIKDRWWRITTNHVGTLLPVGFVFRVSVAPTEDSIELRLAPAPTRQPEREVLLGAAKYEPGRERLGIEVQWEALTFYVELAITEARVEPARVYGLLVTPDSGRDTDAAGGWSAEEQGPVLPPL
jgi:hypothetical protein